MTMSTVEEAEKAVVLYNRYVSYNGSVSLKMLSIRYKTFIIFVGANKNPSPFLATKKQCRLTLYL